ncbi:MAG: class I SAM-dependent methyltransferase [Anaerolineae bacterium]|jgi:demethylmenaquinone methyltransferase/2-methoxy-6-polyprenyl-1,4-benzoquinol methylase|nr:class I SAM-dependent methyltransferase [Anaerolineae bacterium]MBT3712389.1 class I SAM-dependent methyltransferase [Anaerolineae bacterium]MBT4311988.1 class I SAM-dependent methyltransferase [Anaerolineae bacterium]MBT4458136.1 class I SAM-dependent methyltransferase [Anaerolineae bacterium]MBT6059575.1 class I SAM-dependent methyltransferase [Anaerolineae bacterium]
MPEISRVRRSKEEARQTYDWISRWYDFVAVSERKFTNLGLKMLNLQSGETVLEIGFGTGRVLPVLARAAQPAETHGIDISEKMHALAEKRIQSLGLGDAVHLKVGDASKLSHRDEYFDAIFISFTLELFDTPEIPILLDECQRVLKSDGRLGLVALEKRDCRAVRIYEWFHQRIPALVDCRPIYTVDSLEEAGFKISKREILKMWGLPVSIVVAMK